MSKTPSWFMDFCMTAAHWTWRNKYLLALLIAILVGVVLFAMWGAAPV